MKKKIVVCVASFVILAYFTALIAYKVNNNNLQGKVKENSNIEEQTYEVTSYITDEIKDSTYDCVTQLCLVDEFTPDKLGDDADCIVLASVISLDGTDADGSLVGMKKEKMLINTVLKGNLQQGQVIEYAKPGGIMKMSDWEETQPDAANLKREYLRSENNVNIDLNNTYINVLISGDIEIESGKSYLVYLKENADDKYEVIGLGNGLRELNIQQNNSRVAVQNLDISSLEIKNNETGEFESLQEYIDTYITNE